MADRLTQIIAEKSKLTLAALTGLRLPSWINVTVLANNTSLLDHWIYSYVSVSVPIYHKAQRKQMLCRLLQWKLHITSSSCQCDLKYIVIIYISHTWRHPSKFNRFYCSPFQLRNPVHYYYHKSFIKIITQSTKQNRTQNQEQGNR